MTFKKELDDYLRDRAAEQAIAAVEKILFAAGFEPLKQVPVSTTYVRDHHHALLAVSNVLRELYKALEHGQAARVQVHVADPKERNGLTQEDYRNPEDFQIENFDGTRTTDD